MRRLARVMASAQTRSTTSSVGKMMCRWRSASGRWQANTMPLSVCKASSVVADGLAVMGQTERHHARYARSSSRCSRRVSSRSAYSGQHAGSVRSCRPIHCSKDTGTVASGSSP